METFIRCLALRQHYGNKLHAYNCVSKWNHYDNFRTVSCYTPILTPHSHNSSRNIMTRREPGTFGGLSIVCLWFVFFSFLFFSFTTLYTYDASLLFFFLFYLVPVYRSVVNAWTLQLEKPLLSQPIKNVYFSPLYCFALKCYLYTLIFCLCFDVCDQLY